MTTTSNAAYPLETFGPYGPIPNGDGGYQLGAGNLKEVSFGNMSAPSTYDETASAITNLDLETGLVVYTSSSTANLALPTVAAFEAEVSSPKIGSFFDFALLCTSSGVATITTGTGWTLVGSGAGVASKAVQFRARKTTATTWTLYRIAG
jgi:hypothetical protein